jgi:hypothetical protein
MSENYYDKGEVLRILTIKKFQNFKFSSIDFFLVELEILIFFNGQNM